MSIAVTCKCGRDFIVADEYAGLEAECEYCGAILEIPDAASKVSAPPLPQAPPAAAPPSTMPIMCPSCSSPMSDKAVQCSSCGQILRSPLNPEQQASLFSEMTRKLDDYLSDPANLDADKKARGGTFSLLTRLLIEIFVIFVGLTVVSPFIGDIGTGILGMFFAFVFFFPMIITVFNDDVRAHIQDCANPVTAVRRYLSAVNSGQFKKAFYALGPWARNVGAVDTVAFTKIPPPKGAFKISDVASFGDYWKGIARSRGKNVRYVSLGKIVPKRVTDEYAVLDVKFIFYWHSSLLYILLLAGILPAVILIMIVRKKEVKHVRKLLLRREGKWFFASGELEGLADFAAPLESVP